MIQERLNELGSAIVEYEGEKVQLWGFTREETLLLNLNKGIKC
ncbi:hypothetical protein FHR85_000516 [Alkalibacillus almallahensis]|nr:hypothetical protein [Alkalibacillus almallahensis]